MLVSVLASGSEGNCTLIKTKNKNILIDLGMNNKYIVSKLAELDIKASEIDYVFITHTHSDHTGAMKQFFKKNQPLVFFGRENASRVRFFTRLSKFMF